MSSTGKARLTASRGRSRSSLITSRWAMASSADSSTRRARGRAAHDWSPVHQQQVGVLERGAPLARLDLGRAAALDDLPVGQHAHRVGGLGLLQVVRGQEHRGAVGGPGLAQVGPQAAPALRVQARGRLVQEQHAGAGASARGRSPACGAARRTGCGPAARAGRRGRARPPVWTNLVPVAGRHQAVQRPPRVEAVEHRVQPDVLLGASGSGRARAAGRRRRSRGGPGPARPPGPGRRSGPGPRSGPASW